jgi:DNA-binding transcriptional ArsR family regulator
MDKTYKALADPTRREILALLRDRDRTAGEIADEFPTAFATVSHHLGALKDAGLVLATREGQHIRYSLNTTVFQELVKNLIGLAQRRKGRARNGAEGA